MNLWKIKENNYDPKENKKKETIFTLANGYRGLRGFNEFSNYGWKGNFISGIYDKSEAQIQEIVNNPDPLSINFYINEEKINLDEGKIIKYERILNMKKAVLNTNFELELGSGKIVEVFSERFVSKNNLHRWGAKYEIIPKNFSGKLVIESIIDGTVTNSANDPYNEVKHYCVEKIIDLKPGILLRSQTKDKRYL